MSPRRAPTELARFPKPLATKNAQNVFLCNEEEIHRGWIYEESRTSAGFVVGQATEAVLGGLPFLLYPCH